MEQIAFASLTMIASIGVATIAQSHSASADQLYAVYPNQASFGAVNETAAFEHSGTRGRLGLGASPSERWLGKFEQRANWSFCLTAGPCHAASGLRSRWRFGSQGDEENQLSRLPLSARDHPAGDLAVSSVHTEPT